MISLYKYTDKEIKELLKSMIVLVDTREQNWLHIQKFFDEKKIPYRVEKLESADYSCAIPKNVELGIMRDLYFSDKILIERKANLEEVSGNLCQDRTRFENEFIRSSGTKLHLLIENASYEDIIAHKYKTEYNEKAFLATLFTFQHRYGMDINFIDKKYSGLFIYQQLYYFCREYFK